MKLFGFLQIVLFSTTFLACQQDKADEDKRLIRHSLTRIYYLGVIEEQTVYFYRKNNKELIEQLKENVLARGNRARHRYVISQAETLYEKTNTVLGKIDSIVNPLDSIASNDHFAYDFQYNYFFVEGNAKFLIDLYEEYIDELSQLCEVELSKFTKANPEIDFINFSFEHSPVVTSIAMIKSHKLKICQRENMLLTSLLKSSKTW